MLSNDYKPLKIIFRCLLLAISTSIILISLNNILRPYYINGFNRDLEVSIVATSQQNKDALANNVRITNVEVNGKEIDLSKVEIPANTKWSYDSKNDFLYAYNLEKSYDISFEVKNVHTISFTMVQEVGAGKVEIWLDGKVFEKLDLYADTNWDTTFITYNTSRLIFPEGNPVILLAVTILAFIIWRLILELKGERVALDKLSRVTGQVVLTWHLSLLLMCMIVMVQYGNVKVAMEYVNEQPQLFLRSVVLIFLCMEFLELLFGRLWISYFVTAVVWITLLIISNVKYMTRGVPLLPWDFNMARAALSVVNKYNIELTIIDICSIALILGVTLVLFVTRQKHNGFKNTIRTRMSSVLILLVMVIYVKGTFISSAAEEMNSNYRVYQIDNYYEQKGFIPAFLGYCSYLEANKEPENYSKSSLKEICDELSKEDGTDQKRKPTIIAIMNESFWDARRLDTVEFSEELLPNYTVLKSEGAYGNLFTHALNGGTVTSEFEFLTGFSGEFFPQDYMVYGKNMYEGFPSAVSLLESQGYSTLAIHPYIATNYNRENAYEKLGFDDSYFEDDFKNPQRIRNYISDQSVYDMIISEFENKDAEKEAQFIFAVTMQNHGGYWEETINEASVVQYVTNQYGNVAQACMTDYFAGLHESDRALGELIDYFRTVDEEVIVVFFGDHMSDAGPKDDRMFSKTSWNNDMMEYDYETHIVPFLVWNNFEQNSEDWGTMAVGKLLPTMFDNYNLRSTDFWRFLVELKKYYVGSDKQLVINHDGTYAALSDMTEEQKKYYELYELLQYDCIWGEHYASELWTWSDDNM